MTRLSDFDAQHANRAYRGAVNTRRAAPMLPRISDGSFDVDNASEIVFAHATVTEPEDGIAQVDFGGSSGAGGGTSSAPVNMLNNSGGDLLPGDVVVVDGDENTAVTTTTTEGDTRIAGVVQAPIEAGAVGPVLFNGYTPTINAPDAVRGEYAKTATTPTEATSTTDREAGSFATFLTGADFPDFVLDPLGKAITEQPASVESLTFNLPVTTVRDRVLFLALWLEDGPTGVTVDGWTRIGAEASFDYYYRISTAINPTEATWTGLSTAAAVVFMLHPQVSLAVPLEDHDYEATSAAAALSGLSDVSHYAIAGLRDNLADEPTIEAAGWTLLASASGDFTASGTPALVQYKVGSKSGLSFDNPIVDGNVMISMQTILNAADVYEVDPRDTPPCPVDANMVQMARGVNTNTGGPGSSNAVGIQGKIFTDSYSGPFATSAACASTFSSHIVMEFENIGVADYEESDAFGNDGPVDLGTFTATATDVVVMIIVFKEPSALDPLVNVNGFTQLYDGLDIESGGFYWWWAGYKIGDGDASVTLSNGGGQDWAAAAVKLTQGTHTAQGSLVGKYIGHDSAVTSPFSGAGNEDDAIFAFTTLLDAQASALLYGPDLSGAVDSEPVADAHIADASDAHDASAISLLDSAGLFTATDVEAAIAELAKKDIGYQSHGNMGSTETFSALTGWHSGTFNADCTFTFSGATSGIVASMVLELTEDGTGTWTPTWPGSVVWPGGVMPTHDETAGTTTLYLFESRDGGTTWYGFQAGGGTTITFGTPAIVLGTAAATGSIDEVIRRDATIVAFDATVPITQAFSDAAATGSAAVAARRDHKHGMPADPTVGLTVSGLHAHVVSETHLSDGSTTTYTLDQSFEPGSVAAWNVSTLARLGVTETAPDQATVSAAGSSGDSIIFDYAATIL
jgi:hypothetical protein